MARSQTENAADRTPAQKASEALRGAHTLCVERSGFSYLADIPTRLTTAVLGKNARPVVSELLVRPDPARILSTFAVSDELLERIKKTASAVSESTGARKLYDLMNKRVGQAEPQQRKPLRYSLNARHDLQLMRHYLWREGYAWQDTEQGVRIIDVSHAVAITAALQRSVGDDRRRLCPEGLSDYDRDAAEPLDAAELCKAYGVAVAKNPAGNLLRLVHAAREAEFDPEKPAMLRALGGVLDHLEGVAGILPEAGATGGAKERARRLITAARPGVELDPGQVGLLLKPDGRWVPVVQVSQGVARSSTGWLHTLPDGQPVSGYNFMSRPLMSVHWLASRDGWNEEADERLRVLTDHQGEPGYTFEALSKAYRAHGADWPAPPAYQPDAPVKSNPWVQIYNGWPTSDHYRAAYEVAGAVAARDGEAVTTHMAELHQAVAGTRGGNTRKGGQILIENLRICASRAGLLNDGREAWFKQIGKLRDPDSWPGVAPVDRDAVLQMLAHEGVVAEHNRKAIHAHERFAGLAAAPQAGTEPEPEPT